MFKKFIVTVFCLALVMGLAGFTFAKGEKSAVKDKLSVAFSAFTNEGSVRMWPTNGLAIDAGAGLLIDGPRLGFSVNGGLVFPVMEGEGFNISIIPGLRVVFENVHTDSAGGAPAFDVNSFIFLAATGFEFEAFLVKDTVSIGGNVGVALGVRSDRNTAPAVNTSTTKFVFSAANQYSFMPLIIRFYF